MLNKKHCPQAKSKMEASEMMKAKVMLSDGNWYQCEIISEVSASDYDGSRFDVRLTEDMQLSDGVKYNKGKVFRSCHAKCLKIEE